MRFIATMSNFPSLLQKLPLAITAMALANAFSGTLEKYFLIAFADAAGSLYIFATAIERALRIAVAGRDAS